MINTKDVGAGLSECMASLPSDACAAAEDHDAAAVQPEQVQIARRLLESDTGAAQLASPCSSKLSAQGNSEATQKLW